MTLVNKVVTFSHSHLGGTLVAHRGSVSLYIQILWRFWSIEFRA